MRLRAATLFGIVLVAAPVPAGAAELVDSVFQVSYRYAGSDEVTNDAVVPLLPENACYDWYIRLGESDAPKAAIEMLTLPVALADWGSAATDPDDGIDISADGKVATRSFVPELDEENWFSGGWCVALGDPVGRHSIEVKVDGQLLTSYAFEVVLPEDYSWPAISQPVPRERSVDHSW